MWRRCAISGRWSVLTSIWTGSWRKSRPIRALYFSPCPTTSCGGGWRRDAAHWVFPHVAALDSVTDALSNILGQETRNRPGRKHILDEAYFARIEAIQFTIAHDDGVGHENWEEADIVLAGVSRASKTPTSIYLANRGYKTANIPLVLQSPPPQSLYSLKHPMVVGLTVSPERLVQIRRNRLLSLNQAPETSYVNIEKVQDELAFARRMFADNGWPVIDMTRRSIEEAAAAIINLFNDRVLAEGNDI